jgi:hypothetical protein
MNNGKPFDLDALGSNLPDPPEFGGTFRALPLGEVVIVSSYWLDQESSKFPHTRTKPTLIEWAYPDEPGRVYFTHSASERVRSTLIDLRRQRRLPAQGVFVREDVPDSTAFCIYFLGEKDYLRGQIAGRWS